MDGFREVNLKMRSLHSSMFDTIMRSSNMLKRSVVSSNQAVISATASSTVGNTSFTINKVSQMATSATARGAGLGDGVNEKSKLSDLGQLSDSSDSIDIQTGWVKGTLQRENIAVTDGVAKLKEKPTLADGANQLIINGKAYGVAADAESLSSGQVLISAEGELSFFESDTIPARLQVEFIKKDESSADRFSMSTVSTTKKTSKEI